LNADPRVCSVHVKETFSGTVTVHTGGGAIGYFVEGGACCGCFVEICWRDEGNLYTWPSDTTTYDLIPETPLADQDLALDPALCAPKGDAEGGVTYPRVGQSFRPGDFSFLDAAFARDILDESQGIVIPTPLDCRTFSWFSNGPDDVISLTVSTDTTNGPACYTKIRYGSPGTRTLTVIANDPDLGTGSATREVEVVAGDRDVAPIVAITRPAALTRSTSVCAIPVAATGTATDPGGLDVTLAWSLGTFPDDTSVPTFTAAGTGVMVDLKREADIIRLVGTDTAGNEAGMEIPVSLECVQ